MSSNKTKEKLISSHNYIEIKSDPEKKPAKIEDLSNKLSDEHNNKKFNHAFLEEELNNMIKSNFSQNFNLFDKEIKSSFSLNKEIIDNFCIDDNID